MLYAAACVIAVALLAAIGWSFASPAGQQAMMMSAGLAVVVQIVAFTIARLMVRKNMLLGWGLGSVLRLLVLVIYAVVVAKVWGAPLTAALLSFVGFLFVTTLIEPIFLKQ